MNTGFLKLEENKSIYFASDFHLGNTSHTKSLARERKIISWLDSIVGDAQVIFLVGDIFDFWFEYKYVVPKGYVRFLGKLAEISDNGTKIVFFSGNHDLWLKDYLTDEIGVVVFHQPRSFLINGVSFYIGHGDGLGERKYKFYKKICENPVCQWLFKWLHPDISFAIARLWSSASSHFQKENELVFYGEKEWLVIHSESVEKEKPHDFYVYGHRHIATEYELSSGAKYLNLGAWCIETSTYAKFNRKEFELKSFPDED